MRNPDKLWNTQLILSSDGEFKKVSDEVQGMKKDNLDAVFAGRSGRDSAYFVFKTKVKATPL